jgi:hypothetical protein
VEVKVSVAAAAVGVEMDVNPPLLSQKKIEKAGSEEDDHQGNRDFQPLRTALGNGQAQEDDKKSGDQQ